jgi:hypothetical protein
MHVLSEVAKISLFLLGAVLLACQLVGLLVGWRLGVAARRRAAAHERVAEGIGVVVGGLLGLLAFILGLSINMAEGRYQERRHLGLQEANAIGTAWLRAQAVGGPGGERIARELEDYTRTRIGWITAPRDAPEIATLYAATGAAQTRIWGEATAIARAKPDALSVSLINALNETFDLATSQRYAFEGRMPPELPWLLLGLTVLGVGAIGYQGGVRDNLVPSVTLVLLTAWSACIVLIVDLATARTGFVRGDPAPYEWTLQGFSSGLVLPPGVAPR